MLRQVQLGDDRIHPRPDLLAGGGSLRLRGRGRAGNDLGDHDEASCQDC